MLRNFTERLESDPNNENFLEQKKLAEASLSKYKIANKSVINEVDDLCSKYTPGSGFNHVNFYILTSASRRLRVNN